VTHTLGAAQDNLDLVITSSSDKAIWAFGRAWSFNFDSESLKRGTSQRLSFSVHLAYCRTRKVRLPEHRE